MDIKEITDIIYDTLMQNKQYKQLDINKIKFPEVSNRCGQIKFSYEETIIYVNIYCK